MRSVNYKGNSGKFGIYLIRNNVNNKVYIGSTKKNFHSRKTKHKNALLKGEHFNGHLQHSYNKYKEESFTFEVIYIAQSQDEVELMENYYISIFNSHNKDFGYNKATVSGYKYGYKLSPEVIKERSLYKRQKANQDYRKTKELGLNKPVWLFDKEGNEISFFKSCKELCEKEGWSKTSLSASLNRGKNWYKGKFASLNKEPDIEEIKRQFKKYEMKKVYLYDLQGNYINTFKSAREAAKYLSCRDAEIRMCCTGKRSRIKNRIVSYEKTNSETLQQR